MASQALDLTARVEGRIRELKVRLGERVSVGQVLVDLELEPLQLEVAARKANFQAVEAELQRGQVLLNQSRHQLEREKRVSKYTAAEELDAAQNEVALATANLAITEARRAEAKTRLDLAIRDLESARIRAPFTGRITERYQSPGMLVGRATPLVRLISEELRLRFAVPEALAPTVHRGLAVRVRLPALGETLEAQVDSLAPEVDPATRHQKAEARLIIPEALREKVAVGLLAEVVLPAPAAASARGEP